MRLQPQELEGQLRDEVGALLYACKGFDSGELAPGEAARLLGPRLRGLLHDTDSSVTLLQHLGLKDSMSFFDSGSPESDDPNVIDVGYFSLASHTLAPRFVPHLDGVCADAAHRRLLPFDEWWGKCVIRSVQGDSFSRKDLVVIASNKDGLVHIERTLRLPEDYGALTRDNSLGSYCGPLGSETPYPSPVPASLRQIAHEVMVTLALHVPRAFRSKYQLAAFRRCQQPVLHPHDVMSFSSMRIHVEPAEPAAE